MGLTIHYSFKAGQVSTGEARALVRKLRSAALDLPFDEVGEIVDRLEGSSSPAEEEVDPSRRGLPITGSMPLIFTVDGQPRPPRRRVIR
ncbi:MAG: hypothetical protein ACE15C_15985 [Phycisphaerae bacterium]